MCKRLSAATVDQGRKQIIFNATVQVIILFLGMSTSLDRDECSSAAWPTSFRLHSCSYCNPALFTTRPAAAPSGPRLRRFARSRILTGQASTPAVRSVAKRHSHWA